MKVTVGFATIMGTIGAAATAAIPFIAELADATKPFDVSPQVWILVSAGLTAITVLGRMIQAAFLAAKPGVDKV